MFRRFVLLVPFWSYCSCLLKYLYDTFLIPNRVCNTRYCYSSNEVMKKLRGEAVSSLLYRTERRAVVCLSYAPP